jgi:ribosomal protein S18 acetylase RimI-like enzyme
MIHNMRTVRKATPSDCPAIARFQEKLARETENLLLDPETVIQGVRAVFDNPSRGTYFVVETGGQIIACLLTTSEWSDWRNGQIIWIQSVYVLPHYRNRGVFKELYQHIKQLVEGMPDLKGIRLYVDKTNATAIGVYQNCGMDGGHYQMFEWIK